MFECLDLFKHLTYAGEAWLVLERRMCSVIKYMQRTCMAAAMSVIKLQDSRLRWYGHVLRRQAAQGTNAYLAWRQQKIENSSRNAGLMQGNMRANWLGSMPTARILRPQSGVGRLSSYAEPRLWRLRLLNRDTVRKGHLTRQAEAKQTCSKS